jgi:hypothetical protein
MRQNKARPSRSRSSSRQFSDDELALEIASVSLSEFCQIGAAGATTF